MKWLQFSTFKKDYFSEFESDIIKIIIGDSVESLMEYFTAKFPYLLLHTYKQIKMYKNNSTFMKFYGCNINNACIM